MMIVMMIDANYQNDEAIENTNDQSVLKGKRSQIFK